MVSAVEQKLRQAGVRRERRKAESTLWAIFESAADGILLAEAETRRFVHANKAMSRMLGYSPEEIRGLSIADIHPAEDLPRVEEQFEKLFHGEITLAAGIPVKRKEGSVFPADINYAPLELEGRPHMLGIFRDITERKRAEEREKRHALDLLIRNRIAEVFLTVPDEDMYAGVLAIILEAMNSKYGIFGYLDEKGGLIVPTMTPTIWDKCLVPDKKFVFPRETWGNSSWPRAISEKKTICLNTLSTLIPQGHIPMNRHISMPLIHKKNAVVGLIQVANKETDYTQEDIDLLETIGKAIAPVLDARLRQDRYERERKQANEELKKAVADLKRSNMDLEQFAFVASHDLQEPLRMVSTYTQLLARRYEDRLDEDAHDFIRYAVDGANRMQALVQNLLVYSHITTRGSPFIRLDLHEALGDAVANLQAAIIETGAMVSNGELPTVNADRTQLVQVFQNLVGNAIKFRKEEEPPRVHIWAEREGSEWIISVKDNGIGIDPQYFGRLFVIFQRLHGRQEYPGTGIGLALCQQIITRHGGRIWVESAPGEGATFRFTMKA